jgi:hypothetical protein
LWVDRLFHGAGELGSWCEIPICSQLTNAIMTLPRLLIVPLSNIQNPHSNIQRLPTRRIILFHHFIHLTFH